MNINKIKELLYIFKNSDYKDFFGALVLNEKIDYIQDIEDITKDDIKYLEELYDEFLNIDNMTLLNTDLIDYLDDSIGDE